MERRRFGAAGFIQKLNRALNLIFPPSIPNNDLVKHFNVVKAVAFFLATASFWIMGCKENITLNSKLSPSSDTVAVYQTYLPCITHTYFDDSINTATAYPGIPYYQAVGNLSDPFFGDLTCATFFQIIPAQNGFTFAAADTIDSAVLILPYSGFTYGDTVTQTTTQTIQVFYMTDSMGSVSTASYYPFNTKSINLTSPLSAPTTFSVYHLIDSFLATWVDHSSVRVKLNLPTFMNLLNYALNQSSATGNPTEATFINYFNGLCIRPADTRVASDYLPYFQLDGIDQYSEAGVLVFYHANVGDTTYQQFYFNTAYCTHFNAITNSYGRAPVNQLYHSTSKNDEIVALQNQPGACIDLYITGISKLPAGIINKAEVQLTLLPAYNNTTFFMPEKIYATGVATATYPSGLGLTQGEVYNLADRYPLLSTSPYTVLDGYPHTGIGTTGQSVFTLDIPRELMQAIAMKSDTIHLQINGTSDYYGAFHMVAGGGSYPDSNYRAKFKVVYSQLKN